MKALIRLFLAGHTWIYRFSGGAIGGKFSLPILLLTTTGRKSGQQRTLPLAYLPDGDNFVVIASNGGAAAHPGWFYNLQSQPRATIQVKNRIIKVRAELAGPEKREQLWTQLKKIEPAYDKYQQRTSRQIPVVILYPQ
jgi:deazaflavin-dependent oxidoreductase (nitroreductase family)